MMKHHPLSARAVLPALAALLALALAADLRAAGPTPAPTPAPPSPANAAVTNLLVSRPWGFIGSWWYAVRIFAPDGTFSSKGSGEHGTWAINGAAGTVDLNFDGGHVDRIKLPLNPDGCVGFDAGGVALAVRACKPLPTPKSAMSKPVSSLDYLRQTPTPGPADIARMQSSYVTLLVSAPWKITGKGWSVNRIFAKDGTFTTEGHPVEYGTWKFDAGKILLIFNSGDRIDTFDLPVDPKGTEGADRLGIPEIAMMAQAQPVAVAVPAMANPAVAAGGATAASPPKGDPALIAQLVSRPWKWLGENWFVVRVLAPDGTFSTLSSNEAGSWEIDRNGVTLVFSDGHRDTMPLPLKLDGGIPATDSKGNAVAIIPGKVIAPANAVATPAPATSPGEIAKASAVLVAAPWKITGGWWSAVRIFGKDGTFTTIGHPREYGSWKIADDKVAFTYPDGHIDTLLLPLDPNGTDGGDSAGRPVYAVRQPVAAEAPTPAPTAPPSTPPPIAKNTPVPPPSIAGATRTPKPQQTPKSTPPPFGTEHPPGSEGTPPPFGRPMPPGGL